MARKHGATAEPGSAPRTELPRLLDLRGIADHLGTSERHVRRLVQERRIPFIKIGHFVRFDPGEIAEWLETARVAPAHGNPMLGIFD